MNERNNAVIESYILNIAHANHAKPCQTTHIGMEAHVVSSVYHQPSFLHSFELVSTNPLTHHVFIKCVKHMKNGVGI